MDGWMDGSGDENGWVSLEPHPQHADRRHDMRRWMTDGLEHPETGVPLVATALRERESAASCCLVGTHSSTAYGKQLRMQR